MLLVEIINLVWPQGSEIVHKFRINGLAESLSFTFIFKMCIFGEIVLHSREPERPTNVHNSWCCRSIFSLKWLAEQFCWVCNDPRKMILYAKHINYWWNPIKINWFLWKQICWRMRRFLRSLAKNVVSFLALFKQHTRLACERLKMERGKSSIMLQALIMIV